MPTPPSRSTRKFICSANDFSWPPAGGVGKISHFRSPIFVNDIIAFTCYETVTWAQSIIFAECLTIQTFKSSRTLRYRSHEKTHENFSIQVQTLRRRTHSGKEPSTTKTLVVIDALASKASAAALENHSVAWGPNHTILYSVHNVVRNVAVV